MKRLFSATFDADEPLPEDITIKRADLEAVLLMVRELYRERKASLPFAPNLNPAQR
jgi:hypothetical protein